MPVLTVGSLFSGIGGLDLGLEDAGAKVLWQVEADKQCQKVLRHRWPDTEIHEDVREVGTANLTPVDLICGGFPCQDLSVAGKRRGLDADRSGLWFEFRRVVSELSPDWVLIENVPGMLSSNGGRDMRIVLEGLEEFGYWWSYRILDSQYFGVAQRRRRVFIVGHLGGPGAAEVLFDAASLQRNPPTRRETRAAIAEGSISRALSRVGGGDDPEANKGAPIVTQALTQRYDSSEDGSGRGTPLVAAPLVERTGKGGFTDPVNDNIIAFSHKDHGADATEGVSPTLRSHNHDKGNPTSGQGTAIAFDTTQITSHLNRSNPQEGDPSHPLAAGAHAPAITGQRPRRLTPRECERLQGFPDDWTLVDGMADGPRYRMLGNAVTVNVAEWIGQRIIESWEET